MNPFGEGSEWNGDSVISKLIHPFQDGYFTGIYMGQLLNTSPTPQETVSRIRRVLKAGGLFVVDVRTLVNGTITTVNQG